MNQPDLVIGLNGDRYGLAGWHELDRWAQCNSSVWRYVTEKCEGLQVSEEDRLKLLCSELLRHSMDGQQIWI